MAVEHEWGTCRPVLTDMQGRPAPDALQQVLAQVWQDITIPERIAYHQFTCLNRHDPAGTRVVQKIAGMLAARGVGRARANQR